MIYREGETCPACGEGILFDCISSVSIPQFGNTDNTLSYDIYYSICDYCGSELCNGEQAKQNIRNKFIAQQNAIF